MVDKKTTKRSDEIRRRRKEESRATRSKKKSRRKRKPTDRSAPPVMTRDPMVNAVMGKKKPRRRSRRRYDLALNAQGVEMRLPSLPRIRPGWRLFSFSLIALMAVLLYQFWEYPMYQVEAAQVSGLRRLTEEDVNAALKVSGESVFTLDQQVLEEKLRQDFPEFLSVAIAVELPQTVVVTVTERIPVLIWQHNGRTTLVDEGGLAFPLRDGDVGDDLPVVEAQDAPPPLPVAPLPLPELLEQLDEGSFDSDSDELLEETDEELPLLSEDMVVAILTLVDRLPAGAVIKYDAVHGLNWRDPGEWDVYFGDDQDIEMKLVVYDAIYDHLDSIDTRPTLISVEYVHSPYYRLEE